MDFRDLAKVPHKHFYSKHLVISGAGLAYGFARIRSVPFERGECRLALSDRGKDLDDVG